ncbi:MAG: MBL fold metallo-hydrolase [Bacillota bacterium]
MKIKRIVAGMLENNVYVAYDETKECFIVDPGAGFEMVKNFIAQNSLIPKAILLTHGHHDHIGSVNQLVAEYKIPVYVGAEDAELLENPHMMGLRPVEKVEVFEKIQDGFTLQIGGMQIETIATPGHTKGGVCFLVGDEMFTGDSIFKETIGRCDLHGGDYKTMLKSVAKVAHINCNIYPGHADLSTMAHERIYNPYFPNNQ